ncbi:MAG TPA: hypothetical protein VGI75_13110 [Pirellulales bacterium]
MEDIVIRLRNYFRGLELKTTGKWFVLSALIGIVAGLGAITFQLAIQFVLHFALGEITGYVPRETAGERSVFERPATEFRPGLIVAVMIAGGATSGFLGIRLRQKLKDTAPMRPSMLSITAAAIFGRRCRLSKHWRPPLL